MSTTSPNPILFKCPHCGAQTEVFPQYRGQSGPCYCCGKTVTVPADEQQENDDASHGRSPRAKGVMSGLVMAMIVGGTLVGLGLLVVGLFFARPILATIGNATQQSNCEGNMTQLALAMQRYHDDHGSYPPAYIANEAGEPMHSWRVLLLPYLEHGWMHDRYDFNQPWNSPQNAQVTQSMPSVFGCPADETAYMNDETSYMVVIGANTLFPGSTPTSQADVSDRLEYTMMIVEVPESGIHWAEPRDLDARQISFEVNSGPYGQEMGSFHPGGAVYATADGKTYFLPELTPPEYVEALTTINGGEAITPDSLE